MFPLTCSAIHPSVCFAVWVAGFWTRSPPLKYDETGRHPARCSKCPKNTSQKSWLAYSSIPQTFLWAVSRRKNDLCKARLITSCLQRENGSSAKLFVIRSVDCLIVFFGALSTTSPVPSRSIEKSREGRNLLNSATHSKNNPDVPKALQARGKIWGSHFDVNCPFFNVVKLTEAERLKGSLASRSRIVYFRSADASTLICPSVTSDCLPRQDLQSRQQGAWGSAGGHAPCVPSPALVFTCECHLIRALFFFIWPPTYIIDFHSSNVYTKVLFDQKTSQAWWLIVCEQLSKALSFVFLSPVANLIKTRYRARDPRHFFQKAQFNESNSKK